MNNVSVQTPQVVAQLTGTQPAWQSVPAGPDATGLGFFQLLSSVLGSGGEAALAAQLKKNAETLGAQINAEMLAVNPLLSMMLSGQAGLDTHQQTSASDIPVQAQPAFAGDTVLSAELLSQLQNIIDAAPAPSAASTNTNSFQSFAAALGTITADGDSSAEIITASQPGSAAGGALALQGQSQFERAVSQAQQLMKEAGDTDTSDTAELDLEALQKKVDSGAFLQNLTGTVRTDTPLVAQADNIPDAQEIFTQIKTAVTRHAEGGATDFTIKLRPEGLGEITVKLLETGGKVTLSLAASDANVQRLLGSELNNLRDIMRPYNVEVAQVVQSNEAQSMNMQQQFSQQFSHHGYTGQQQTPSFAYDTDYGENAKSDEPAQAALLPDSALDAYI